MGPMSVMAYRDAAYLPEAIVNYRARLGWSHGDAKIFAREHFVECFDLEHLGKPATQHDQKKLDWLNARYIRERTTCSSLSFVVHRGHWNSPTSWPMLGQQAA
jgi:glutamyl/glutaminyl-tRNA synthetase